MPKRDFLKALDLLQEEAAELIVAISKLKRFGPESVNPYESAGKSNHESFVPEIGDIKARIDIIQSETDYVITDEEIERAKVKKMLKLEKYFPYLP